MDHLADTIPEGNVATLLHAANAEDAQNLWEDAGAVLPDNYAAALTPYLGHQHEDVRSAAADGLAAAVEVRCAQMSCELTRLMLRCGSHGSAAAALDHIDEIAVVLGPMPSLSIDTCCKFLPP